MKLRCKRCNHIWIGGVIDRKTGKVRKPKRCVNCKSPNWNRKKLQRERSKSKKWRK